MTGGGSTHMGAHSGGSELECLLRGPVAQQRAKLLVAQLAVAVGVKGGHLLREAERGVVAYV